MAVGYKNKHTLPFDISVKLWCICVLAGPWPCVMWGFSLPPRIHESRLLGNIENLVCKRN